MKTIIRALKSQGMKVHDISAVLDEMFKAGTLVSYEPDHRFRTEVGRAVVGRICYDGKQLLIEPRGTQPCGCDPLSLTCLVRDIRDMQRNRITYVDVVDAGSYAIAPIGVRVPRPEDRATS